MKAVSLSFCLSWVALSCAQRSVLINEIQPSNQGTFLTAEAGSPDWIEIHNPTDRTVDLMGMRLVIDGDQYVIEDPLKVGPHGFRLLWCDRRSELGPDHLPFTLSREGGSLLLIAPNGTTIIDVFTWPKLYADESIGRRPDGARTWKIFGSPTPGRSNNDAIGTTQRTSPISLTPAPGHYEAPILLTLNANGEKIIYTTDGSEPHLKNGTEYTEAIAIDRTTTIRAKAYSTDGVGSRDLAATFHIGNERPAISLIIDRPDLWDTLSGIGSNGPTANYSRMGREWERPAWFQGDRDTAAIPIGLRISGSGSRGSPKRSFKLYARNRYDSPLDPFLFGGSNFNEAILRADATPNAFLRNLLIEAIVQDERIELAVQPSQPVDLYLNAEYQGLYRWMPPKDAQWLRKIAGADEVDILEGPANEVIAGSDEHFKKGLQLLIARAPIDSLKNYFDLESLIDLACSDLFTGRADHDLNVRTYRSRTENGRWKWVLFDMDLWAPVTDNSLERMATSSGIETPYFPQLLADPDLQRMLLARMSTLNATLFAADRTIPIADSIFAEYHDELDRDHTFWKDRMNCMAPVDQHAQLKGFLQLRGAIVMEHLAGRTGKKLRNITIDVPDPAIGKMSINGLPLRSGKQKVQLFAGIDYRVEIELEQKERSVSWSGSQAKGNTFTFDPARTRSIKPKIGK